ncbi:hypothetical protein GCM10010372_51560 [Streptomyces tauricus]|nr:hypothetical protein GCM10010372_51560 [Streptomyces tauricus]
MFRRALLYAGPPNSFRWYDVADPGQPVGARALIYLRRRDGAGTFRKFVNEQLSVKQCVRTTLPHPFAPLSPSGTRHTSESVAGASHERVQHHPLRAHLTADREDHLRRPARQSHQGVLDEVGADTAIAAGDDDCSIEGEHGFLFSKEDARYVATHGWSSDTPPRDGE